MAYNAVVETFDTLPKARRRDPDSVGRGDPPRRARRRGAALAQEAERHGAVASC